MTATQNPKSLPANDAGKPGTLEERVTSFQAFLADHAVLRTAYDEALSVLKSLSRAPVVVITGPTGVGKTALANRLTVELETHFATSVPDACPVMQCDAMSPQLRDFSWKYFHERFLFKYGDILPASKLVPPRQEGLFPAMINPSRFAGYADEALRLSVENCLQYRQAKILLIDEAHHILMVRSPEALERQFETIKSLAAATKTTIVLIGTYGLLGIRELSSQLVRRSRIIHFSRYDSRVNADKDEFVSVLSALQEALPITPKPDLLSHWSYYYGKSAGCVGVLKDWLTRSLEIAIRDGVPLDYAVLDRQALKNRDVQTLFREAMAGEERLRDIPNDELAGFMQQGTPLPATDTPHRLAKAKAYTGRKVGQRKPKRDLVGFDAAAVATR
jgi:hypothetical protein